MRPTRKQNNRKVGSFHLSCRPGYCFTLKILQTSWKIEINIWQLSMNFKTIWKISLNRNFLLNLNIINGQKIIIKLCLIDQKAQIEFLSRFWVLLCWCDDGFFLGISCIRLRRGSWLSVKKNRLPCKWSSFTNNIQPGWFYEWLCRNMYRLCVIWTSTRRAELYVTICFNNCLCWLVLVSDRLVTPNTVSSHDDMTILEFCIVL